MSNKSKDDVDLTPGILAFLSICIGLFMMGKDTKDGLTNVAIFLACVALVIYKLMTW